MLSKDQCNELLFLFSLEKWKCVYFLCRIPDRKSSIGVCLGQEGVGASAGVAAVSYSAPKFP